MVHLILRTSEFFQLIKITTGNLRLWFAGTAFTAGILLTFASRAGRMLVVDAPEKSDLILVLAGEADYRPKQGLRLLDQGYGRVLILNVPAAARIYGFSETELAQKEIQPLSEAPLVRVCPITGLSTKEEAHDAAECMGGLTGKRVLLVTSEYHTRRALSIFRHEVRDRAFSVSAVYDETQFGVRWWQHRQWAKTFVDEWLRVLWWNAVDRWR